MIFGLCNSIKKFVSRHTNRTILRFESLEDRNLLAVIAGGSVFSQSGSPFSDAEVSSCETETLNVSVSDASETSLAAGSPVDLDGDGFIGSSDYAILSAAWLTSEGDEAWNPVCDIDGDGFIGSGDLSYMSINWFKSADDPDLVNPVKTSISIKDELSSESDCYSAGEPFTLSAEDTEVTLSLAAVSEPTANAAVLRTGSTNFGTFYYLPNDQVPVTVREDIIDAEEYYLEVWVSDTGGTGLFTSSLQIQLNYDTSEVISVTLEDLYAGKITIDSYDYYDTERNFLKSIQVGWLFSAEGKWSLMSKLTDGENAWLLARFTVTVDTSSGTTPAFSLSGVTEPYSSPFVEGFYYVRTGENNPIDDSLISAVNVPAYSRLWKHSPDIDQNGIIATGDWGCLFGAWHTGPGDESWNELCDINGDDYVDDADLNWLIQNWLSPWED